MSPLLPKKSLKKMSVRLTPPGCKLSPSTADLTTTELRNTFATGKGGCNCLKNASDGFMFVFDGGPRVWQEAGGQTTVVTEILIY